MEFICMCGCVFLRACGENSGLPLPTSQLMDEVISLQESSVAKEDVLDESVEETQDMYINEIEITEAAQLFKSNMFCLSVENFNKMTRDETLQYFGVNLDISSVLPNFQEDSDSQYGIFKFPDGSVFDQQTFIYRGEQEQTLRITMRKDMLPASSLVEAYAQELVESKVMGQDVIVARYINKNGSEAYYAESVLDNLGVMVTTEDMTLDDFTAVLVYFIQEKEGSQDNQ